MPPLPSGHWLDAPDYACNLDFRRAYVRQCVEICEREGLAFLYVQESAFAGRELICLGCGDDMPAGHHVAGNMDTAYLPSRIIAMATRPMLNAPFSPPHRTLGVGPSL